MKQMGLMSYRVVFSKHKNSLFTMVLMEALYSGKYTFKHYCYSVIFACKSLVNFSISRYWRGLLQTHFQIWLSLGVFSGFLGIDVSSFHLSDTFWQISDTGILFCQIGFLNLELNIAKQGWITD